MNAGTRPHRLLTAAIVVAAVLSLAGCRRPTPPVEPAELSENWQVQGAAVIVRNPPETESDSRLVYQITVEPKNQVAYHGVQVIVRLDDSMKAWAPSAWLTFRGEKVDLGPGTGYKGQKLGLGRYIPRFDTMAQSDKEKLKADLAAPVILDISWDGGREILKVSGSQIRYKEFDRQIVPE